MAEDRIPLAEAQATQERRQKEAARRAQVTNDAVAEALHFLAPRAQSPQDVADGGVALLIAPEDPTALLRDLDRAVATLEFLCGGIRARSAPPPRP